MTPNSQSTEWSSGFRAALLLTARGDRECWIDHLAHVLLGIRLLNPAPATGRHTLSLYLGADSSVDLRT